MTAEPIMASTTIVDILRRYPAGEAAQLMSRLHWPCAHCGGAIDEPLTSAAKRHRNSPKAVLAAFRSLDRPGGPSDELVADAARKITRERTPIELRYGGPGTGR